MKSTKKLLSLLLALCMVFSLACTAFAAEEPAQERGTTETDAFNDAAAEFEAIMACLLDADAYTTASYAGVAAAVEAYGAAEDSAAMEEAVARLKAAVPQLVVVPNSFEDASSGWYVEAVNFAQASGAMKGVTDTSFEPGASMTRGMVVTVLYRLAGSPDVEGMSCPFTDLDSARYYYAAAIWAYNAGIFKGTSDTTFSPGAAITREMMAAVLIRLSGVDTSELPADEVQQALENLFEDAGDISNYAKDDVCVCALSGLMVGSTDGCFHPKEALTRAQFAQVLYNVYLVGLDAVISGDAVTQAVSMLAA